MVFLPLVSSIHSSFVSLSDFTGIHKEDGRPAAHTIAMMAQSICFGDCSTTSSGAWPLVGRCRIPFSFGRAQTPTIRYHGYPLISHNLIRAAPRTAPSLRRRSFTSSTSIPLCTYLHRIPQGPPSLAHPLVKIWALGSEI